VCLSVKQTILRYLLDGIRDELHDLCGDLNLTPSLSLSSTHGFTTITRPLSFSSREFHKAFSMSTFAPEWSVRLEIPRSRVSRITQLRNCAELELPNLDPIFSRYTKAMQDAMDQSVQLLHRQVVELEFAEDMASRGSRGMF
jgi:hypothetical protein